MINITETQLEIFTAGWSLFWATFGAFAGYRLGWARRGRCRELHFTLPTPELRKDCCGEFKAKE